MGLCRGVGVNDLDRGSCYFYVNGKKRQLKFYRDWSNMLRRCYADGKTYSDCSVHADWLILSNFKKWHENNYVKGWELDKDLLVDGSKVYSEKSCSYIPKDINIIFCNSTARKGDLPQGVSICPTTGLYRCRTREYNKEIWIGRFYSAESAVKNYNLVKKEILIRRLERHKDDLKKDLYKSIAKKINYMYG